GSYRSFLRDPEGKRSILYPYKEYVKHWVIGFLYSRNPNCEKTEIKEIMEASNLQSPYEDIEFFVQEKYKIAGKKPGSGNTTNIGSIGSNKIKTFQEGNGVFKTMKEFEDYWRNY
ncbi:MAG: type II restriction endonuclease, partial [bacterium]